MLLLSIAAALLYSVLLRIYFTLLCWLRREKALMLNTLNNDRKQKYMDQEVGTLTSSASWSIFCISLRQCFNAHKILGKICAAYIYRTALSSNVFVESTSLGYPLGILYVSHSTCGDTVTSKMYGPVYIVVHRRALFFAARKYTKIANSTHTVALNWSHKRPDARSFVPSA